MTDRNENDLPESPLTDDPQSSASDDLIAQQKLVGRRRLVKASLAAVPVMLTLRSRTAWGHLEDGDHPAGHAHNASGNHVSGVLPGSPGGPAPAPDADSGFNAEAGGNWLDSGEESWTDYDDGGDIFGEADTDDSWGGDEW